MQNYYDYDDDPSEDLSETLNEIERVNKTDKPAMPEKTVEFQRKLSTGEDNDSQIFEENEDVVTENELIANTPPTMPENKDTKENDLQEQFLEIKHENKTTVKAGTTQKARKRQKINNDLRNKLMHEIEAAFDAPPKPDNSYRYDDIMTLKKSFKAFKNDIEFLSFMKKLAHEKILDRELFMLYNHVYYYPHPENYYIFFRSNMFAKGPEHCGCDYYIKECIRLARESARR